jgi:hypothetical protein
VDQAQRLARNESRFRKVNESIDAGRGLRAADESLPVVCECGRLGCTEVIEVPVGEYERVRASGRRFIVCPDHVADELEHVVERAEGHVVVEKEGRAAAAAERADPRRDGHPGAPDAAGGAPGDVAPA